jgi:hypothetical protein
MEHKFKLSHLAGHVLRALGPKTDIEIRQEAKKPSG